jgi:hypothetical protein
MNPLSQTTPFTSTDTPDWAHTSFDHLVIGTELRAATIR